MAQAQASAVKRLPAYPVYLLLEIAGSFLFSMIFTTSMVYQVQLVGLSPLQLVLVGTTLELAVLLFEVPTGVIADIYSRRSSIIIGYVLIGVGFIVEGSFPYFIVILFAQVMWGLGYTFTSGATQAWITDEIGEAAANRAFLRSNQLGQLSALLGIGAGTMLGLLRINLPIQLGGLLLILVALFLVIFMPEHGFHPIPRGERSSWQHMKDTFVSGVQVVRHRPELTTILVIGLFYGLYSEGFDRLWTKHILDDLQMPLLAGWQPVVWIGIMRAVGMIFSAGVSEVLQKRLKMDHLPGIARVLLGVTVVLFVSLLAFARLDWFGLALLAYWLIYVSRNLIEPLYTAWVNLRLDSGVRATVISMSSQVDAFGQIAGGPVVGWIGSAVSVRAALTVSGLLITPIIGLYMRLLHGGSLAVDDQQVLKELG